MYVRVMLWQREGSIGRKRATTLLLKFALMAVNFKTLGTQIQNQVGMFTFFLITTLKH